jgi:hypothetical protein
MIHHVSFLTSVGVLSSRLARLEAHHNREDTKNAKLTPRNTTISAGRTSQRFGCVSRSPMQSQYVTPQ